MMFKNSVKLFIANFANVWKILLYYIIITLIGVGLIAPVFSSISVVFRDSGFIDAFTEVFTTFNLGTNFLSIFSNIANLFNSFIGCVIEYFQLYTGLAIYIAVVFVVIMPYLYGLISIPVGQSVYGYMSSQTKLTLTGRIFSKLWKSTKFLCCKLIVATPINLLIIFAMYKAFAITTLGGTIRLFAPLILTTVFCALLAFRLVVLSGWLPALVVYDCAIWKAFKRGLIATGRKFFVAFSTLVIICLLNVSLNLLLGSFSIIVWIPVGIFVTTVFYFVMFFESHGMRYYVDSETIITPKKLEEVDKFKRCKDII